MTVSPVDYRRVLSRFATGVTIVTLKNESGLHGLTVNSFTSVSLEPPLILICIQKDATSHSVFSDKDRFVVNILCQDQEQLSTRFADPELTNEERFQNVAFKDTSDGIPILEGTLGHLECQVVNLHDAGDHTIFIGEVLKAETRDEKAPLLFYNSQYLKI